MRNPIRSISLLSTLAALALFARDTSAQAPEHRTSARAPETETGRLVDADTGEPIADAWVFEVVPAERRGADVRRFSRVRETRTDAQGRFRFEPLSSGFFSALFSSKRAPRLHAYHPSYGLVWGRGTPSTIELSLREAYLRKSDAHNLCVARQADALHERIRSLACPPARPDLFPDGRPRAEGRLDPAGRRTGWWTYYREDRSVIARGRFEAGAATGQWEFRP